MSSYFDNQYGGEDDDNKFKEVSDSDEYSDSESESEEINDEQNNIDDDEAKDEYSETDESSVDSDEQEQEGGAVSELEEGEIDEEAEESNKRAKKIKKIPSKNVYKKPIDFIDEDDENTDDDGEEYYKKFEKTVNNNYILDFHPESIIHNYDEILSMTKVIRNDQGVIVDKLHRTIPNLTKYEKSRVLGQRASQINSGAQPFVKVPENIIDGYLIAEMELKKKLIPFIIRRPLPNGGSEYWKLKDLEDISF